MSELKKPEKFIIPENLLFERGYNQGLSVSEAYYTNLLERLEATAKELFLVTDDTVYLKDVLDLIKQAKVQK